MREVIFRGKRIDNGKWVEGYYVYDESGQMTEKSTAYIYHLHKHPCGWSLLPCEVVPETVGQYIGLTDKNGKKIFEGDIVKAYNICGEEEGIGVVRWSELFVAWHYANNKCMYGGDIASYEVIGNTHENPELIKEV